MTLIFKAIFLMSMFASNGPPMCVDYAIERCGDACTIENMKNSHELCWFAIALGASEERVQAGPLLEPLLPIAARYAPLP